MIEVQTCLEHKKVGNNLKKNHAVFNLKYLVEIFKELYPEEFEVERGKPGRPVKYLPEELLPVIFWGKENNKESCRELAEWMDNNDETCQFLLNCKKPSKNTFNRFKNNHAALIDKFDQFIIDLGSITGLIDGEILYGDGTILKAYCNQFKKMYPYEIDFLKQFLIENVGNPELWGKLNCYFFDDETKGLKEELKGVMDELHYNLNASGFHLLKQSLKSEKNFKKVMERIRHMEENINGEKSISIVDPEARHMLDKSKKMGLNYNYQTVTDSKYGFRIAHYITNAPIDQRESKKMVELATERLHRDDYILTLDNGYWDPEILKEIIKGNTRILIPDDVDASRKKEKMKKKRRSGKRQEIVNEEKRKKNEKKGIKEVKKLNKPDFDYIYEEDVFECPITGELFTMTIIERRNGEKAKRYDTDYCITCQFKDECNTPYKKYFYEPYEDGVAELKDFYYSDEGQEIYAGRAHYAETCFGTLLESRNFRGIKTRGIEKANNELTLCEIHHNLKKLEKHLSLDVLKSLLKYIREMKRSNEKVDMTILNSLKGKFIMKDDIIIGIDDVFFK